MLEVMWIIFCMWLIAAIVEFVKKPPKARVEPIAEPTKEEQRASWQLYARQLVDEINRAQGMIDSLEEPKPYIVRRCSRRRCKNTTDQ